jgi:hypothetical protein
VYNSSNSEIGHIDDNGNLYDGSNSQIGSIGKGNRKRKAAAFFFFFESSFQ